MIVLALSVAVLPLQDPEPRPDRATIEARVRRGEDVCPVRWGIADDGRVRIQAPAYMTEELADELFPPDMPTVALTGFWFVHGPADALATADLELHLRRTGVSTRTDDLRQYVVTADPESAVNPALRWRARLDRVAAVRLLARRGEKSAVGELRAISKTADDPALREAALGAVAELEHTAPAFQRTPFDFEHGVPEDADLLLFLDQSRLPPLHALHDVIRRTALSVGLELIERAGPLFTENVQSQIDRMAELPFEITRRFGHLRMDAFLLAFQTGMNPAPIARARWVMNAAGSFDPERLAAGMGAKVEEGRVELDVPDLRIRVDATATQTRIAKYGQWSTKENVADLAPLRAQGLGAHALWIWLPEGSRLEWHPPWPPLGAGSIRVDFVPKLVIDAAFAPSIGEAPETLLPAWTAWLDALRKDLARSRAADAPPWLVAARPLAEALADLTPKVDGDVVRLHLEGEFEAAALVAFLRLLAERE